MSIIIIENEIKRKPVYNFILFLFILLIFTLIIQSALWSQDILTLDDKQSNINPGPFVQYLEDKSGKLTINEIAGTSSDKFIQSRKQNLGFGFSESAYWIRFIVDNKSQYETWYLEIEYPFLDYIDLIYKDAAGNYFTKKTGRQLPFNSRLIKHHNFVFPVFLDHHKRNIFFLRLQTGNDMTIPMSLKTAQTHIEEDRNIQFSFGAYYGIMAVMFIFNLILFIFIRDKIYIILAAFIASWILLQLNNNGISYEYLWPDAVWWNTRSEFFFIGLVDLTALYFAVVFLSLKERLIKAYYYITALIFLSPFLSAASLLWYGPALVITGNIFTSVCSISALIISVIIYFRGHTSARFYILAWTSFLVGTVVYMLALNAVIPLNFATKYGLQIGSTLVVVLLSVALADRYRLLRIEKEFAEQINIQHTEFFTNLSHEIKTPLTLISNYLDQYISDHGESDELSVIKRNIDKLMQDMINFFDVIKFEKGIIIYDHDRISDISRILAQKVELAASMAYKKDISIASSMAPDLYVKADPLAVERIVNNLLDNAIRYNKKGGSIDISLTVTGGSVCLGIADTGIGIEKEYLHKVFEPYYQISHRKRNIQGIGMGLSLVKNIVDSLGGTIFIESAPGKGSSFTILLKQYLLQEGDEVSREILSVKPSSTLPYFTEPEAYKAEGRKYSVLIVEDNVDLLNLLGAKIGKRYAVRSARNGAEALEALKEAPAPDVIVSDIMMDEMDGYEFFDTVAKQEKFKDIPFIFVTARSLEDDKLDGLRRGAIDYIYKPFLIEELIAKIDSIIRYQELRRAVFEKDKFASLGMLLGGISHEIFNPLSGITGPLANLRKIITESNLKENEKLSKYLDNIETSVAKIENIINTIRILYSDKLLRTEPVNIYSVMQTISEKINSEFKFPVTISVSAEKNLNVAANSEALAQILDNLVTNAVEAIDGEGRIDIAAVNKNGITVITVSDTGRGIPREDMDKIFNAFYTTKDIGKGIGLGLNIVKNLVMKLGWDISAESTPGKGTTFTITIRS